MNGFCLWSYPTIMTKEVASSNKCTLFKTDVQKPRPIYDQNGQNRFPICDQNGSKPYPLGPDVPIAHIKERSREPKSNRNICLATLLYSFETEFVCVSLSSCTVLVCSILAHDARHSRCLWVSALINDMLGQLTGECAVVRQTSLTGNHNTNQYRRPRRIDLL